MSTLNDAFLIRNNVIVNALRFGYFGNAEFVFGVS